ncbi:hypothetical protein [Caulobacter sp. 602-1]|uniref:hypothetical protein n=1 Tax=Caulobacter sp. 602-1 TaxID=2492472 RepID=UPI000F63EFC1|nr:hypothetical protein [Caulobacter sp. 602-1]RRN64648.1 hypothetical protein EIK80_11475 [Caulobacter sp. 602-1]
MTDLPDFLSDEPSDLGEAPVTAEAAPALAAPEPEAAPPEAAEPEAPVAPVEPQAQPTPNAPPPGYVPLSALLDTRDRAKEAEARARALEAQINPPQIPDPFEDPEGFAAHQAATIQHELKVQAFNNSKLIAESSPDAAMIPEALAWAQQRAEQDPGFRHQSFNHHHPVGFALQEFKRHKAMTLVGDDPDEFVRKRAAELGFVLPSQPSNPAPAAQPAPAPITPQRPVAPRPSLAATPSAGRVAAPQVRDGEATYAAMFDR